MNSKYVVTLGPIGYFSGSGTWASLLIACGIYLLHWQWSLCVRGSWIIIGMILALVLIHCTPGHKKDPRWIVLDEAIGSLCMLWSIVPKLKTVVIGLILFRIIDIIKPWPLYYLEFLPGSIGIVADDIAAGFISNGIVWYLIHASYL